MLTIEQRISENQDFFASLPRSRAEAKKIGATRYVSERPCPRKHNSWRSTASGGCAKCASIRASNNPLPPNILREQRLSIDKRWNESEKGKSAKQKWRLRDPKWSWVTSAMGGARHRAKKFGLPIDLTSEYLYSITPDVCPVFQTEFIFVGIGQKNRDNKRMASLDRIRPNEGYVKGNVCVISCRANAIKSNASLEEIQLVIDYLKGMKK